MKAIFRIPRADGGNGKISEAPTILIFRWGRPIGHLRKAPNIASFERWIAIGRGGRQKGHASRRSAIRCLEEWAKTDAGFQATV